MMADGFFLVVVALVVWSGNGWLLPSSPCRCARRRTTTMSMQSADETTRRGFFNQVTVVASSTAILASLSRPSHAVVRAVGGAEEECRAAGNCLETGELDGAVGWSWGAKDRCDATDPRCGPDGRLREEGLLVGESIPQVTHKITDVVELKYSIGREEFGVIRLGLYGEAAPKSVSQFIQFATNGLRTTSDLVFENGMGLESLPVALNRGGILGQIVPGQRLDFGVPLQSFAYARSKGISKAGENFLPQPRPKPIDDEPILRPHTVAGLLSIPGKGIGFGGSGFESEDECFESSFQITAAPVPSMDKKEGRRVIGQVIDQESMSNLARLSSLPTKKGFKGVIPGQNSGPPLLKVSLTDINVFPVKEWQ